MLKAVIFDFDGVLFNSAKYYLKTRELFFKRYNIKFTKKEHKENLATTTKDFLKYVNKKYNLSIKLSDYISEKHDIFYSFIKEIKPNPGIINLLKTLKKKNIKIVLSSSNEKENILFLLNKYNILDYFDLILTSEDIKRHKPYKDAFYNPLTFLKLSSNECVGIEDSLQGIVSIHRAGLKSVGVLSEFTNVTDFKKLKTSLIVKSTKEITFNKLNSLIKL
jgi:HAD superfamily hydrolase (TIGR01509 family)